MKILVVVDSIDVNDSSGSKVNVALIDNLALAGFEVKVYHYTQKNIKLSGVESVLIPENRWSLLFVLSRIQRIFTRLTGIHLHRFFENIFGFSFTFFNDSQSIVKALKKEVFFAPNLILTLSKAASFRPHYAMLQLPKWHKNWMAYVHDPYPFHFYPKPYAWVEQGHRQKENFFKEVSEKAEYVAFPSLLLKEWMGSFFPEFLSKGVVIPHQLTKKNEVNLLYLEDSQSSSEIMDCDAQSFNVKSLEYIQTYFRPISFTLLHAGNLLKQRSPLFLIQAFNLFLERFPLAKKDAQLVLIGPASYHEKEVDLLINQMENISFINKSIPFKQVQYLQQKATVNIILESKSEISPFLPGKFPIYISANKPILLLGPLYSESKRLLGADYPYWAEVDDVEKITDLIGKLYKIWQQNSSSLLLNRRDLEIYLGKEHLKNIIIKLLKG